MKELDRLKRFVKFDKSFSIDGTHLHIAAWALSEIECLTAENDRLAALEAVQTAEPVAWVDMEHLNDMREHAERTGRWQTVIAATAQNVPNKVPLYATPQQAAPAAEPVAWLIELQSRGNFKGWFRGRPTDSNEDPWTTDANRAIKFVSKSDADLARISFGLTLTNESSTHLSTEHVWIGGSREKTCTNAEWLANCPQSVKDFAAKNATPQQAAAPAGMQLVPIEPTREMINSAIRLFTNAGFADIYKAMLKAAPKAGGVS